MAETRKLIKEFFKNELGFCEESIIMIDQKEILEYDGFYEQPSSSSDDDDDPTDLQNR